MNRIFAITAGFFFLLIFQNTNVSAQITLETTYSSSGTYTTLPISGTKFYIMDVVNSQCKIYNQNHTLWKTINLSVPANNYLYDIKYVSENLFTTDNSLCLAYIYYSYNETGQYYTYNAKIIKENGTILRSITGCQYLYVHSLADGSTKMVSYSYNYSIFPSTIETAVFDLAGSYVSNPEVPVNNGADFLPSAFPNPANVEVMIPYVLPEQAQNAKLVLFDINGKNINSWPLDGKNSSLRIPTASYPRGPYLYHIEAENYRSVSGKLILQ